MDRFGLITLREELREDCRVFKQSAAAAAAHLAEGTHGRLEATAFELARAYNVVEQMCLRIAREFENHLERDGGWHDALLRRMTLQVPGIRPALFGADVKQDLDELRRFRHLVHHAYDVILREDRILALVHIAAKLAGQIDPLCEAFVDEVAVAQGWTMDNPAPS